MRQHSPLWCPHITHQYIRQSSTNTGCTKDSLVVCVLMKRKLVEVLLNYVI